MMRIAFFGYRSWAFAIVDTLIAQLDPAKSQVVYIGTVNYEHGATVSAQQYPSLEVIDPKNTEHIISVIKDRQIDLVLFYGWSWIVPGSVLQLVDCLCIHPSLLPRYRGGTPWQHQIMAGEQSGGLTIFKMDEGIDAGPILQQREFSLAGRLSELFSRLAEHGAASTLAVIHDYENGTVNFQPQENLDQYPPYKRFDWKKAELRFSDLQNYTAEQFYNFVRALDDPYPNCSVLLDTGQRLFIREVQPVSDVPTDGRLFDGTAASLETLADCYLAVADGYLRLIRGDIQ